MESVSTMSREMKSVSTMSRILKWNNLHGQDVDLYSPPLRMPRTCQRLLRFAIVKISVHLDNEAQLIVVNCCNSHQ